MSPVLNLLTISVLFQAIVFFIGCFGLLYFIFKDHNKVLIYAEVVVICGFGFEIFQFFALYYNILMLFRVATTFFALAMLWVVFLIDYLWLESPNVIRMGIACILGTLQVVNVWSEGSIITVTQGGYTYLTWSNTYLVYAFIGCGYVMVFFGVWLFTSWVKCPPYLKPVMNVVMIGGIVFVVGTLAVWVIFGLAIANFVSIIGVVILGLAGVKNIKILYILPFTAHRITVVEFYTGLCLYDKMWAPTPIDEMLLAGLLKGLDQISIEVLQKGSIREVKLDDGILLIEHFNHISVGLLASRSSNYLKLCLSKFAKDFDLKYFPENVPFNNDMSKFKDAGLITDKYFDNISTRIVPQKR